MDQPPLLQSRKFWIMCVDLFVSVSGYFLMKYADPRLATDALFLIGALQPVVLAVIASITVQNVQAMKASAEVETSKNYAAVNTAPCPEPDLEPDLPY
jgi:hypothetical protein